MRRGIAGLALVGAIVAPRVAPAAAEGGARSDLAELRAERAEEVSRYRVRELTGKRITAALELLEQDRYAEARAKLDEMNYELLNARERALAYRLVALTAFGQEQFDTAIEYFGKAVEQQALTIDDEASARFSIAQLRAAVSDWPGVLSALDEWRAYVEEPSALAYYLEALAHYEMDEFERAVEPARRAVELSPAPREGWLQLLAGLYLQKEDYASATPLIEELVVRFPKKQYWVQLSMLYAAREDHPASLAVQQLAYAQGLLHEDRDLRRLARSFLYHDLPESAALVIEKGLADGTLEPDEEVLEQLGNSWIAAREFDKAVGPLSRAAALSDDGKLYLRLAQVHVQREQWEEATRLLREALAKGGLDDRGRAELLLGIACYSGERPEEARAAFERAAAHESTRAEAGAWLEHMAREGPSG